MLFPLHVPRVTPRLFGWFGTAGVPLLQPLTVIVGRPPANASVVAILTVRAPIWLDDRLNLMVTGPTALKIAMGKESSAEEPTV